MYFTSRISKLFLKIYYVKYDYPTPQIFLTQTKAFAPTKSPVQISLWSTHAKFSAVWQRLMLPLLRFFQAALNFARLES